MCHIFKQCYRSLKNYKKHVKRVRDGVCVVPVHIKSLEQGAREYVWAQKKNFCPSSHVNRWIIETRNEYSFQPIAWKPFSKGTNKKRIITRGEWLVSDQKFGSVVSEHVFSKIKLSFQRAKTVLKEYYQTENYESMCSLTVGEPRWGNDGRCA